MAKFGLFPIADARTIRNRVLGGSVTEFKEFTQPRGGGGAIFFELVEDMPGGHGERAWANFLDWDDEVTSEGWVYNWGRSDDGIIGFYPAGFYGVCTNVSGRRAFNQAKCSQKCITGTYIPQQSPTDAIIGDENYEYEVAVTGAVIAESFSAVGLPEDWTIDSTTGVITGPTESPGVVGPAGEIALIISANATGADGTCTVTRRIVIKIVEPEGGGPEPGGGGGA